MYMKRENFREGGMKRYLNGLVIACMVVGILALPLSGFAADNAAAKAALHEKYRQQAKKHHPDLGGDSATFRKIHKAYEDLLTWAENPTFIKRRGFPDKWFYSREQNRWVQPIPETKEPII